MTGHLDKKRVVIVDDSRTARAWLKHVLDADPYLQVVGEAADAFEAREIIKALNPDVITLDIEMPKMSGLEFLARLMKLRPMPVVMVSAATNVGSIAAVEALSLGAMDCLVKPTEALDARMCRDIAQRVFSAACGTVQSKRAQPSVHIRASKSNTSEAGAPIILIGASTGGVTALEVVLESLDPKGPPVVIVQHMPGQFLSSFSQMLDRKLSQRVALARNGEMLSCGDVVLAPAQGQHTEIVRRNGRWQCQHREVGERGLHCPSVDALFSSAGAFGHDAIAVLLTGLGRDGADGMALLRRSGAHTIGQNEATCVIYGMPRAAQIIGAVVQELPIEDIGDAIKKAVIKHRFRTAARSF